MSELKRCPFCGGEAKIDKTITNTVSVECTVCHASSRIILCTEGDIEQKAIKAWNTRKPMDRIVERLEQQAELYRNRGFEIEQKGHSAIADKHYGKQYGYLHAIEIVKEEGGMNEKV